MFDGVRTTKKCAYQYDWPASWDSSANAYYSATIDVSAAQYSGPDGGTYIVCVANAAGEGVTGSYVGDVSFPALTSEPVNTVTVSSTYGETVDVISNIYFYY